MIAKRIRKGPRPARKGAPAQVRKIIGLTTYAVDADPTQLAKAEGIARRIDYAIDVRLSDHGIEAGEKVAAFGARNLRGRGLLDWQAEMIAVALQNPRSRDPIEHYVISWGRGEHPSEAQMNETVDVFLDVLGCAFCQTVWAAHTNTFNDHLHLVVNRVDPTTHKMVQVGDGWDLDRLAQACALVERRQGWSVEGNALYEVNDLGEVARWSDGVVVRTADGVQTRRAGDRAETRDATLGQPLMASIQSALRTAESWDELHARLAKEPAKVIPKGSGAVVVFGIGEQKRASFFGDDCSFSALLNRLGSFEEVKSEDPERAAFLMHQTAIRNENRSIRDARAAVWRRLDELDRLIRTRLDATVKQRKMRELAERAWRDELAKIKTALGAQYDRCLAEIDSARISASEWALERRSRVPKVTLPAIVIPTDPIVIAPNVEGFQTERQDSITAYYRARERRPAFIDHRVCIVVYARGDAEVLAALRLGVEKWGQIQIYGAPDFKRQCLRLAAEHGIGAQAEGAKMPPRPQLDVASSPHRSLPAAQIVDTSVTSSSTYPQVYVVKEQLDALRAAVRVAGFEVGMAGHVRFDRERRHFLAVDTGLPIEQRQRLAQALTPYTTESACRSWQLALASPSDLQDVGISGRSGQPRSSTAEFARSPDTNAIFRPVMPPSGNKVDKSATPRSPLARVAQLFHDIDWATETDWPAGHSLRPGVLEQSPTRLRELNDLDTARSPQRTPAQREKELGHVPRGYHQQSITVSAEAQTRQSNR